MDGSYGVERNWDPGPLPQEERIRCLRRLIPAVQQLSRAHDHRAILEITRSAARDAIGADAATIVIREREAISYADAHGAVPLWRGKQLPAEQHVRDWVMANRRPLAIADIAEDARIPHDRQNAQARGMVMVPIGAPQPMGTIGAYWARPYKISLRDLGLLQVLADAAAEAWEAMRASRRPKGSLLRRAGQLLIGSKPLANGILVDELTGLYNRPGFFLLADRIRQMAVRLGVDTFILCVKTKDPEQCREDVSRERSRRLAALLRSTLRSSDIVARLDNGFGVFGIEGRGSRAALERRLACSILPFDIGHGDNPLAMGYERAPADELSSIETLLKRANDGATLLAG